MTIEDYRIMTLDRLDKTLEELEKLGISEDVAHSMVLKGLAITLADFCIVLIKDEEKAKQELIDLHMFALNHVRQTYKETECDEP